MTTNGRKGLFQHLVRQPCFGHFKLVLGYYLEFGAWILDFGFLPSAFSATLWFIFSWGEEMDRINIGLIGLGTVGTGLVRILQENGKVLEKRLGVPMVLKRIADQDITRDRGIKINPALLTTQVSDIIDDPEISRHHARVVIAPDSVTIEDLGSKNGTFVREERIATKAELNDGDEIRLGTVPLAVRIMMRSDKTKTAK